MRLLDSIPTRARAAFPLATLAVLALSASAAAQTYTAKAGAGIGGDESSIGSTAVMEFWDGSWTQSTRHAWSKAHRGYLEGQALCNTYAQYNMAAYGIAEFKFDDVIFTSPGSGSVQVGLKLTIDGNSAVTFGNGFRVNLMHGSHGIGTATRSADGTITASYDLGGWDMNGGFSFMHAITVPVNTPVALHIQMDVSASAVSGGHMADGHYELRLGGATPIPMPGELYEVFDLPAGVTVDSAQAGISNNLWSPPHRLHLHADREILAPGEAVTLVAWNGIPGERVGFSLAWGPALPAAAMGMSTWSGYTGIIDGDEWAWSDPIPYSPVFAGSTMRARAYSFDAFGAPMRTGEVEVQFQ
jgi:hypothetical protein